MVYTCRCTEFACCIRGCAASIPNPVILSSNDYLLSLQFCSCKKPFTNSSFHRFTVRLLYVDSLTQSHFNGYCNYSYSSSFLFFHNFLQTMMWATSMYVRTFLLGYTIVRLFQIPELIQVDSQGLHCNICIHAGTWHHIDLNLP